MREILLAHRIPILEVADFEADDVIATLVRRAPADAQIAIVSTDKDLMQLVGGRVVLLDGMKERRYDEKEVEERFGVPPSQLLDLRALAGDASDNIPGVKGIGAKGAAELIREWGDLESLLAHAAEVASKRAREALLGQMEQARLSKRLATLRSDVPLPLELEAAARQEPDCRALRALFERLGFSRLLAELGSEGASGAASAGAPEVRRIETLGELDALVAELRALPAVALAGVFGAQAPMSATPAGLAFALAAGARRLRPARGRGAARRRARARRGRRAACARSSRASARGRGRRARRSRSRSGSRSSRSSSPRRPSTSSSRRSCSIPAARDRSRRSRRRSSASRCAAGRISPGAARRRARRARSPSSRSLRGPARRPAPRSASRRRSRTRSPKTGMDALYRDGGAAAHARARAHGARGRAHRRGGARAALAGLHAASSRSSRSASTRSRASAS